MRLVPIPFLHQGLQKRRRRYKLRKMVLIFRHCAGLRRAAHRVARVVDGEFAGVGQTATPAGRLIRGLIG